MILLVNSPTRRMQASLLLKKKLIHLPIEGPKLNFFKHLPMHLFDKLSKTFFQSIRRIKDFIIFLLLYFITFRMLMIYVPIALLGIQAFCCCPIPLPASVWSRSVMQLEASLQWMERREIDLQSFFLFRVGSVCPSLADG